MCLPCIPLIYGVLYAGLPFLWLVMMPLVGAFSDTDSVLRLSLLLHLQSYLSTLIPRYWVLPEPLVQGGILVALLSLPMTLTPWFMVSTYSWIMWTSEPLWLLLEVAGVVRLSIACSRHLVGRTEDQPLFARLLLYAIAIVCYCVMLELFWVMALSNSSVVKCLLAPVVVLVTLVHIAAWFSDAGTLSDAAVVGVFTMSLLYSMLFEESHSPYNSDQGLSHNFAGISFSKLVWKSLGTTLGGLSKTWRFLVKLLHPWLIATAVVRIYSVLIAISWIKAWLGRGNDESDDYLADDDDDDDDVDDNDNQIVSLLNAWKSPLTVKLVVIYVYTQLVIHHLHTSAPVYNWSVGLPVIDSVSGSRITQLVLANCYYVYFLWKEHTDDSYDL